MAWCATATSQVSNDQQQGGDVTASQQFDVVTNPGDTTTTVTATGNSGSTVVGRGRAFSGSFLQTSGAATIDAESQIDAAGGQTGNATFSVQAVANTQQLVSTGGAVGASVSQSSASTVTANGGAVIGEVAGQGAFAASGAGNSFTSAGQGSSGALDVTQANTGAVTQGALFVNLGQSGLTATSAAASGDNATVVNTGGSLAVSANQDNQSFVHAEAVETSFAYGGATVDAAGVGNSVVAANVGPGLALDNVQLNGAQGVESSASFQGAGGSDASVSAAASGNSVTGFACSSCGGVMNVANSQTNFGDAAASSQIGPTGAARSVHGVATAAGNTATFVTAN
jgi:hypothetical protein